MQDKNRVLSVSRILFGDACFLLYHFNREAEVVALTKPPDRNYHQHPFYELHFCKEGTISFTVEEKEYTVEAGQAILIAPGHPHFPMSDVKTCQRIVISFNMTRDMTRAEGDEDFYDFFSSLLALYTCDILPVSDGLREKLLLLESLSGAGNIMERCRYIAAAYGFISCFMEELNCSREDIHRKYAPENDLQLMLENMVYDFRYSLPEIAQRLGYSKRHVSRLIRQKYGMSLSALRESIMYMSAKMIMQENPEAKFQEILEKSGFMSATALYRAFMKREGCPPSEYRKRLQHIGTAAEEYEE